MILLQQDYDKLQFNMKILMKKSRTNVLLFCFLVKCQHLTIC